MISLSVAWTTRGSARSGIASKIPPILSSQVAAALMPLLYRARRVRASWEAWRSPGRPQGRPGSRDSLDGDRALHPGGGMPRDGAQERRLALLERDLEGRALAGGEQLRLLSADLEVVGRLPLVRHLERYGARGDRLLRERELQLRRFACRHRDRGRGRAGNRGAGEREPR